VASAGEENGENQRLAARKVIETAAAPQMAIISVASGIIKRQSAKRQTSA